MTQGALPFQYAEEQRPPEVQPKGQAAATGAGVSAQEEVRNQNNASEDSYVGSNATKYTY